MSNETAYSIGLLARRAAKWCERTFGRSIVLDKSERAERILEEAAELAQAEGVAKERAQRIVERT